MGKGATNKRGQAIPLPGELTEPPALPGAGPWVVVKVRAGLPMRMPSGFDEAGEFRAGRMARPEFVAVAELMAEGVPAWTPVEMMLRPRAKLASGDFGPSWQTLPMFQGYVFARLQVGDGPRLRAARERGQIRAVAGVMARDGLPQTVSGDALWGVHRHVVERRHAVIQTLCTGPSRFQAGAWVSIISGPFKGLRAFIESVEGSRAAVSVPGLKAKTTVGLDMLELAA